jgi:hypothetical protein
LDVGEIFTEQSEREAVHSPLHNAKVENSWGLLYIVGTFHSRTPRVRLFAFYRCPFHMLLRDMLIYGCGLLVVTSDAFVLTFLRHSQ